MKEIVISKLQEGQRLDRILTRLLPAAGKSFLYKMLRKKNITLNGKKATGTEKVSCGDSICIYFSEETLSHFMQGGQNPDAEVKGQQTAPPVAASVSGIHPEVLYEDTNYIFLNKPVGILSQKAKPEDISMVEILTAHLLENGSLQPEDLLTFHPGICNRLDRNTSGILAAGKTTAGLQTLSRAFHDRSLRKYYLCLVQGTITQRRDIRGYLWKDTRTNHVRIFQDGNTHLPDGAQAIETAYLPVCSNRNMTLLKVHLLTGRSHQIRAHLASIGHPIAGDFKYGDSDWNAICKSKYGLKSQLLHAYELELPELQLHLFAPLPEDFIHVLQGEHLWEPGTPEALEALH